MSWELVLFFWKLTYLRGRLLSSHEKRLSIRRIPHDSCIFLLVPVEVIVAKSSSVWGRPGGSENEDETCTSRKVGPNWWIMIRALHSHSRKRQSRSSQKDAYSSAEKKRHSQFPCACFVAGFKVNTVIHMLIMPKIAKSFLMSSDGFQSRIRDHLILILIASVT